MDYLQYFQPLLFLVFLNLVLNLIINGLPSIRRTFISSVLIFIKIVLNLIINGLPSIQMRYSSIGNNRHRGFKPYYKWITFNTRRWIHVIKIKYSFKPYYKWITFNTLIFYIFKYLSLCKCFKPYYKWITFNTFRSKPSNRKFSYFVLNLIINGLPSIPLPKGWMSYLC